MRLLELAKNTRRLFDQQEPREKRRLLNFVVSNCSWKHGELTAQYRQPFDLLADTTKYTERVATAKGLDLAKTNIWLPFLDTYRIQCLAPDSNFERMLAAMRHSLAAA